MNGVLLSSESYIKTTTNISDNLAGGYILPALREVQEHNLRDILGDALLDKVKTIFKNGELGREENVHYADLVNRCQDYLAYMCVIDVTNRVSYKVTNFGVAKSNDENLQVATYDEIVKMQYYYQTKADSYCLDLQNWLLDNKSFFPELTEAQCHKIHSSLHSSASCGIFLGGARGKSRTPKCSRR